MEKQDYNTLFFENEKLVPYIFNKYFSDLRFAEEDLLQSGRLGLWKACTEFDPAKKTKFGVFAFKCIKNEMLHWARKEIAYRNLCDYNSDYDIIDDNQPDIQDIVSVDVAVKGSEYSSELKELFSGKTIKQISKHSDLPYHKLVRRIDKEKKKIRVKYEGTNSL